MVVQFVTLCGQDEDEEAAYDNRRDEKGPAIEGDPVPLLDEDVSVLEGVLLERILN